MARFQVLSLIGGGIRGAFITSFLRDLEQNLGKPIAECFDLIAGTSTGGIIAAGLASGMSAEEVHQFYVQYGAKIFTPRPKYRAKGYLRLLFPPVNFVFRKRTGSVLDSFLRARYCPDALYWAFSEGFGDRKLGDVDTTRLIIPTVNLTRGKPHIFRSSHLPEAIPDQDISITDVLVAATAAPTYFPHKMIKDEAYADGGLWAPDPSSQAIAESMRVRRDCHRGECTPTHEVEDIHLLSIGTGRSMLSLKPPGADAGMIYWAKHVADVMGASQTEGIHESLEFWLGDRYKHVNFDMEERWPLDAVENIPKLFEMGSRRAKEVGAELHDEFFQHTRAPFVSHLSEAPLASS